eukprot:ctg_107.g85
MKVSSEKVFNEKDSLHKPRPLRPKSVSPFRATTILGGMSKDSVVRNCGCIGECNCFPWLQHTEFYTLIFSPPNRSANPIVKDKSFLLGTTENLDSFSLAKDELQDIFLCKQRCSSGDSEDNSVYTFV